MRNRTVMGIFDRPDDAEKVKDELLEAGVARHRIVLSRLLTEDGIAAEAPGQFYENQQPDNVAEPPLASACVLSVVARSPLDKQHIADLMLRHGARRTLETRSR